MRVGVGGWLAPDRHESRLVLSLLVRRRRTLVRVLTEHYQCDRRKGSPAVFVTIWKRWVSWATEKRPIPIFPMSRRPDGLSVGSAALGDSKLGTLARPLCAAPDVVEQVGKSGGRHAHAVVHDRQIAEPRSICLDDYLIRVGVVGVRHKLSHRRPWLPVDAVSDAGKNPFVCPEAGLDRGFAGTVLDVGSKVSVPLASRIVRRPHRFPQLLAWRRSRACCRGGRTATITPTSIEGPATPRRIRSASNRGGTK